MIDDEIQQIDLIGPEVVEIKIRHDSKVIWVNVNGVCRFRACMIKELILEDDRIGETMRPVDKWQK